MSTTNGDVVLVHINSQPAFFARIEKIDPDVKPEWWQVTLLVLQVPLKTVVWILRQSYIEGTEFTMGGTPIVLEKVTAPPDEDQDGLLDDPETGELSFDEEDGEADRIRTERPSQAAPARVISLTDRLKK